MGSICEVGYQRNWEAERFLKILQGVQTAFIDKKGNMKIVSSEVKAIRQMYHRQTLVARVAQTKFTKTARIFYDEIWRSTWSEN